MNGNRTVPALAHAIYFSLADHIETIFVAAGSIGSFVLLAFLGQGGLVGTDILADINIALNGIKATTTAYNRYFYLLLERIFLKIAPTPLSWAPNGTGRSCSPRPLS